MANKELNIFEAGIEFNAIKGGNGLDGGYGYGFPADGVTSAYTATPAIPANWRAIEDISQSHHFTVKISGINVNYPLEKGSFKDFLPVQSISFSYVGFNSLSLPVGIYGDLPLLKSKSVGKITLSLYDNDRDEVEYGIRAWEESCFPEDKYVGYLDEIVREFQYTSYTVTGKPNGTLKIPVIPAESYSINRGYEENAPKIISFALIVVGNKVFNKGT